MSFFVNHLLLGPVHSFLIFIFFLLAVAMPVGAEQEQEIPTFKEIMEMDSDAGETEAADKAARKVIALHPDKYDRQTPRSSIYLGQ